MLRDKTGRVCDLGHRITGFSFRAVQAVMCSILFLGPKIHWGYIGITNGKENGNYREYTG